MLHHPPMRVRMVRIRRLRVIGMIRSRVRARRTGQRGKESSSSSSSILWPTEKFSPPSVTSLSSFKGSLAMGSWRHTVVRARVRVRGRIRIRIGGRVSGFQEAYGLQRFPDLVVGVDVKRV